MAIYSVCKEIKAMDEVKKLIRVWHVTKNFLVKKERFPIQIDTGCSIKSFTLEDTKSTVKMKTLFMFFALFTSFHMGKY